MTDQHKALASREEAPATPSAATPAAPGEVTDEQIMALLNPYVGKDCQKHGGIVQFARELLAVSAQGRGGKL